MPSRVPDHTVVGQFSDLVCAAEKTIGDLALEDVPAALGELERLRARLTFRALSSAAPTDRLLGVSEAAELLGIRDPPIHRFLDYCELCGQKP